MNLKLLIWTASELNPPAENDNANQEQQQPQEEETKQNKGGLLNNKPLLNFGKQGN